MSEQALKCVTYNIHTTDDVLYICIRIDLLSYCHLRQESRLERECVCRIIIRNTIATSIRRDTKCDYSLRAIIDYQSARLISSRN